MPQKFDERQQVVKVHLTAASLREGNAASARTAVKESGFFAVSVEVEVMVWVVTHS